MKKALLPVRDFKLAIASQQAYAATNREPTELELRLLFFYVLLLYRFHLQFGRR